MRKAEFIITRLASAVLVLLGVSVVTFFLARVIPSNPAAQYIGPHARPEEIARVAHELGFDRPLPIQYLRYMGDVLHGDFGISIASKRPVLTEILTRLPHTLELIFAGMSIAIVLGLVMGVVSARWRGTPIDYLFRTVSIFGISIPAFWLGLLLQILFFRWLGWLPFSGEYSATLRFTSPITPITHFPLFDAALTRNWVAFRDVGSHLLLPALTLAAFPAGLIARMTRGSMLESLEEDYIRTARAYGLSERLITFGYALKNAVGPTLSVIGLSFAFALTGSFFVEVIFSWPGLGLFTVRSLLALDFPAIMGITFLGAVAYILINLLVDLIQAWVDPRVTLA
jgi:peptide/nickel transport system permease protein